MNRVDRARANLEAMGLLDMTKRIAGEYHVTLTGILNGCRKRSTAAARHRLWALMRHTLDMSAAEIADAFVVDRSTVDSAVQKREAELALEHGVAS